jgi:C-5 cytosine-specific DNA methylase
VTRPLAIDLCSGLGGWAEGLEAAGWDVIRVDIADMFAETGTPKPPNCLLMLQDIRTFHGSQAKRAGLIVASPPCQEFSWMAMPWRRAKQVARALRGEDEFPANYRGSRTLAELTALFDACFRIQREASEAAGHHIPMVLENVRGAIPWVGRSRANFGSYHLWGDVPALMPMTSRAVKVPGMGAGWVHPDDPRHKPGLAFNPAAQGERVRAELAAAADGRKLSGFRFDGSGRSFQSESVSRKHIVVEGVKTSGAPHIRDGEAHTKHLTNPAEHGLKHRGDWFSDPSSPSRQGGQVKVAEGRKGAGAGAGAEWFDQNLCVKSSNSPARKAASAKIAKIPLVLATWIGRAHLPAKEIAA